MLWFDRPAQGAPASCWTKLSGTTELKTQTGLQVGGEGVSLFISVSPGVIKGTGQREERTPLGVDTSVRWGEVAHFRF